MKYALKFLNYKKYKKITGIPIYSHRRFQLIFKLTILVLNKFVLSIIILNILNIIIFTKKKKNYIYSALHIIMQEPNYSSKQ